MAGGWTHPQRAGKATHPVVFALVHVVLARAVGAAAYSHDVGADASLSQPLAEQVHRRVTKPAQGSNGSCG